MRQNEAVQQQEGVVRGEPGAVDSIDSHKKGKKVQNWYFLMHKSLLQGHHKNRHAQGVASLLLTLDKSAMQSMKLVISVGHYQSICKTGKVAYIGVDSDGKDYTHLEVESDIFLGTLTTPSVTEKNDKNNPWELTLHLNSKPLLFKINTGADCSIIPEAVFSQLQGMTLHPVDHCLIGPGQNQLEVSGQFKAKLIHQNSVAKEHIYVVRQLQKSLLG